MRSIGDSTISRYHAGLCRRGGIWVVRDFDSTSGAFVTCAGNPRGENRLLSKELALSNNSIVWFGKATYNLLPEGERA
jgi:pSer/pThr/pTyr-binding forkhead associated (FHA) protein